VFSAPIIESDARKAHPALDERKLHVLPQGRCTIPSSYSKQPSIPKIIEELSLAKRMENLFIVIGAGSVQFRKGVDLFLQTAATVQCELRSRNIQFVWIGKGYDPDLDKGYSIYLREQALRSKLSPQPIFLDEMGDLNSIYAIADVLMLSSRLDPLPNVSIDAATLGVPIVCFEDASGIADILKQDPITSSGVVNYSDTTAAADVIRRLATDESERKETSDAIRRLAEKTFDLKNYVARLDEIGRHAMQISVK
jgi:glycosyltransferase involved in cell wall biosynthesis